MEDGMVERWVYQVKGRTRRRDSIGTFQTRNRRLFAVGRADAKEKAMDLFHRENYEVNWISVECIGKETV